ncbi:MAG: prepilin-type N-terminal cleavage/methylation domain-containing protein [Candidatus Omnitrophica bacterium]|nr:prepilin-type N-terminal cleavage/methylation domain-containing protein [Candidatus Omnitrophota bacterium]MCM8802474.1 prepilin-type N-terminal cleavage/methylation domain-containing protein [Candidatus Omnitrophota bacterium]
MWKKGFTILEILIAITILVIVFVLVTVMYIRGSRIRNVVVAYNEVGEILSQMTDVIANGRKRFIGQDIPGLKTASKIDNNSNSSKLIYSTYTFEIIPDTQNDTTIFLNNRSLDPNKKVVLLSGSKFEYYYADGSKKLDNQTNTDTITYVKIILYGKSTSPAMKNMVPIKIETGVRLKNTPSF